MRVNLRGHEMCVAEEFLHAAKISAAIKQMRGVTVPKLVRCEVGIKSRPREVSLEP